MPVEAKPLFRPEVLRPLLATFRLPHDFSAARVTLDKWAKLLSSDQADSYKEKELLPDFLGDFLCGVLGYKRAVDSPAGYTVSWEKHVQVDGKFADAVIGDFRPGQNRFVIAIEGKGPKDPLDRPHAGRKMSAVDQGYRYAINLPCDWIIVTSIRQTRLYHKGSDQHTFEGFDTVSLAKDDALLKKFVFLLGADRVVPPVGISHLDGLAVASEKVGKDLTKEYYVQYANMREDLFEQLCRANPSVAAGEVLASTQKLLDRVLFCAFSEDRGLLPPQSIQRAYTHADPYNPRPIWDNFKGLFRSVNAGNPHLNIPAYNGGLFADDPALDHLTVPDNVCLHFQKLAEYEYRPALPAGEDDDAVKLVDVNILGHIFEQSINDLERLHNELEGRVERQGLEQHASRRKKEGAFYTPNFITRYIVGEALGSVLLDKFEALRQTHAEEAKGTARQALVNPRVYDTLNAPQRDALIRFWEAWQDEELANFRILDPSCGSGAFLIEAFEQLYQAYQARSNDHLEDLRGERTLFDPDRRILQSNLYGVNLNDEAIQICRLSLWIKTAQRGKVLTTLDHNIRVGNSVIADPAVHPRAFDWQAAFPEVFEQGGFDVVVGNPPYVRQEWIAPYKPYFKEHYQTYHGVADLFVYFYELGMRVLRPGGRLSFVVTNKWLKAAYGEPLRQFFADHAWVESLVDFGHAKQIFEDADVFPSVIVARKPNIESAPKTTKVCAIPREQLRINDLASQIASEGFDLERSRLNGDAWTLEPKGVTDLLRKLATNGTPLSEFTGRRPYRGILTGFNEAFLIDTPTRNALVTKDTACEAIIRPYLRGQDVRRWCPEWADLWMIIMRSSGDHCWPWSDAGDSAETVFRDTYPSLYNRMKPFEDQLRKRQDKGRFWWELRSCAYWHEFEREKLIYQEIQFHPSYTIDAQGRYGNNKTFFIPSGDLYLVGVLNSPLMWWHNWRFLPHMKDEALSPVTFLVEKIPIASPTDDVRSQVEIKVKALIETAKLQQQTRKDILDWLKVQHGIADPSTKLQNPIALDSDGLIAEVKKLRGKKKPLSLAAVRDLREEHARTIEPAQALAAEARRLERRVSDLVNEAYGLTPDEVRLMWETAPPRMPIAPPHANSEASADG